MAGEVEGLGIRYVKGGSGIVQEGVGFEGFVGSESGGHGAWEGELFGDVDVDYTEAVSDGVADIDTTSIELNG